MRFEKRVYRVAPDAHPVFVGRDGQASVGAIDHSGGNLRVLPLGLGRSKMAEREDRKSPPITIKKYANRRLYNTATSSYVTLEHLCRMVKEGVDFNVYDAKTGDDITRVVLTQIIMDEEAKGDALLPTNFLRQLISLYGDSMQWMVPRYLEQALQAFAGNQERLREYFQATINGMFPFGGFEDLGKRNLAMMEQAVRIMTPPRPDEHRSERRAPRGAGSPPNPAPGEDATIVELRREVEELRTLVADLAKAGAGR